MQSIILMLYKIYVYEWIKTEYIYLIIWDFFVSNFDADYLYKNHQKKEGKREVAVGVDLV